MYVHEKLWEFDCMQPGGGISWLLVMEFLLLVELFPLVWGFVELGSTVNGNFIVELS